MSQQSFTERPRRLRLTPAIRRMGREISLSREQLIYPIFVHELPYDTEIKTMPNIMRHSVTSAVAAAKKAQAAGLGGIILFGIPEQKDQTGSQAYAQDGITQRALRAIKAEVPDLCIIADTCLCEYTNHGHCGNLVEIASFCTVENDTTLDLLALTAVSQAKAGADIIAPSAMMDGQIQAIRNALDAAGYAHVPVMSYAVKYASAYYGPFREAAGSAPSKGDRASYQMDMAGGYREAMREARLDCEQGADYLMVKPALAYLDVLRLLRDNFDLPLVAYNVSGEYSMVKAAAAAGYLDEKKTVLENLLGMRRAGADIIISYHALEAAAWL